MSLIAESTILAPFEIWEVPLDDERTIKFNEPFIVKPEILPPEEPGDETYWTVDVPELNISAHGLDYEELRDCIESCIRFTWKHIVQIPSAELDRESVQIRSNYLSLTEVIYG